MSNILTIMALIYSFEVYSHIKIALTFDDGPALSTKKKKSPTRMILETLKKEKITAAFFFLTGPDRFMGKTLPRGESDEGLDIIKETIRDGHLLACHWGGSYYAQSHLHPNRIKYPAYDFNNDGVIDKVTAMGNALETDLLQCISRLQFALVQENIEDNPINYVRPPLWKYKNKNGDARATYKELKLKMILTDAKLYDGGFGIQRLKKMMKDMMKAIKEGEDKIILTLHDPMRRTARNLKKTILKIKKTMLKNGYVEGEKNDWSFVKNKTQMKELFLLKDYFYLNKVKSTE